jgi:hypothetical protein
MNALLAGGKLPPECGSHRFSTWIIHKPRSYGILPHSRKERQDAASPPCEVNVSIPCVFEVLPEVAIRQRLAVFGRTFFVPQISNISLF